MWIKESPPTLCNVNWYTHYGEQYGCSSKVKNRNAILSSNPIPGHIFRQNYNSKRSMHPCVHNSTIHNSWNKLMSTDRWMDKENVVHIHSGILPNHKKEWNNAISATWMQLEIIILSQKDKDKYHITCMWTLNYDTNQCTYETELQT